MGDHGTLIGTGPAILGRPAGSSGHTHARTNIPPPASWLCGTHAPQDEAKALKKANAKPLTAYMLFAQRKRASVVAQNPGLKVTEVAKLLGAQWKSLSEPEQQAFRDESKKLLEEWTAKQH